MRHRLAIGTLTAGALGGVAWRAFSKAGTPAAGRREDDATYARAGHRVLILGSGFGGLEVALGLDEALPDDADVAVLAIDRTTSLLYTPLLWMVADGRVGPSNVVVPIRAFQRGRRFQVMQGEITHIDLERREVVAGGETRPYDTLVIALGSETSVPDLPGLREHARVFQTPADAVGLRDQLIASLEAAHRSDDPAERRAWLTFVVGGGGDTGIELAATIHDFIHSGLLAEYPWLEEEPARIVIVGRSDRLVPMSDPGISAAVRQGLEAQGIEVRTGCSIEAVTADTVTTSQGEIPARTLFWAAGVAPPALVKDLPVEHAKNGAVIVDAHLRVPGHPEVFVLGDSAWAHSAGNQEPVPPTAQAAQHQGRHVARAIAAALDGRDIAPFRFAPKGHLALLGGGGAIAKVGKMTFTGLPAWLLWHGYYLSSIPTWGNRLHLLADWVLAGLTGRQTVPLRLRDERVRTSGEG